MAQFNTFVYDSVEYQALLNDTKDQVIERINADHNLSLNPAEYMFVLQQRGSLGRIWDKLFSPLESNEVRRILIRVSVISADTYRAGRNPETPGGNSKPSDTNGASASTS